VSWNQAAENRASRPMAGQIRNPPACPACRAWGQPSSTSVGLSNLCHQRRQGNSREPTSPPRIPVAHLPLRASGSDECSSARAASRQNRHCFSPSRDLLRHHSADFAAGRRTASSDFHPEAITRCASNPSTSPPPPPTNCRTFVPVPTADQVSILAARSRRNFACASYWGSLTALLVVFPFLWLVEYCTAKHGTRSLLICEPVSHCSAASIGTREPNR
jgi:hypothetical protein